MDKAIIAFDHLIRSLEAGKLHSHLSQQYQELMIQLQEAKNDGTKNPAGSLTLELKFRSDGRTIDVVSKVTTKPPTQPGRERTTFFVTPDNHLTRRDPIQMDIEDIAVRSVPDEPKSVITDAG